MENQPAAVAVPSRCPVKRFGPWLVVLLVLLFAGYIRVRLLELPLERDEGEYAYAGQLVLQGIPPYELAYNMKLPGTYFVYALGMAVFGQTTAGVHLTLLAANSLTVIFVFLLGRTLFGVTAGLVAGASYAMMSLSPAVAGLAAHATQFVVMFAMPATWWLWKFGGSNRPGILFWSGLFYGLAFLMKQPGICFGMFGWMFLIWLAVENQWTPAQFAKKSAIFGLGMILPFGLTCLALAGAGVFARFWFWIFTYAAAYATVMPWREGLEHLTGHLRATGDLSSGLWLLAVVGFLLGWNRSLRRQTIFTALFWLGSFLGTALGLYFRPHYFILALPGFALLIGMGVVGLQRILRFGMLEDVFKSLPLILFATILGWVVFYQSPVFFQLPPTQVCQMLYRWNPFLESPAVAGYLREHSAKNARLAVIGSEPEIYFEAQRRSATGYIYTYPLMEPQPNALKMQQEMIREIESARPEYLVYVSYELSWLFQPSSDHTILRWFDGYAGRFYERVGIVRPLPDGKIECFWDAAAKDYRGLTGHYLAVYKRKLPAP